MAPRKDMLPSQHYCYTEGFGPLSSRRSSDNLRVGTRRAHADRNRTSSTSRAQGGSIRGVQRNRPGSNTRMSMAGNRTVSHADVVMQWDASFISQPSIPHYDPSVGHRVMQNQAAAMNNPLSASATHASNTSTDSTPVRMINKPVKGLANTKTTPSGLVDSHKEEKAIKALVSNTLLIACLSDKKVRKEKMLAAERPDLRMGMSKITK